MVNFDIERFSLTVNRNSILLGETLSFECLIYSLFEFVQVLMDISTYKNSVKTSMEELCYYLILCMQITEEEVWRKRNEIELELFECFLVRILVEKCRSVCRR